MRKAKYLFILICLFIFPNYISAQSTEFTLFDSNIVVGKDRTLAVDENYRIYFIENTKNIERNISTSLKQISPNESAIVIDSKIDKINSENSFKTTEKGKMTTILLNTDGYQDEVSDYHLSYEFNLGKDQNARYDEFYYDIVSNLDSTISNLTFSITFPSTINYENIYFSIDGKYNLTEDDIAYTIEDNKVIGTLNKLLESDQTFSIYVKLPNNYFTGATDNFNYLNFLILIFPIIGTILIVMNFIKYGYKNELKVKNIKDIPNNFDSAEIGYLFKGKLEEMDLTSVIIYLANQGYIQIVENDDGYKLGKENSFKFIKLKDYDRNNAAQQIIFENLFRDRDVVELQDIEYQFAQTFKEAKSMLDNKDNENKLFFSDIASKKLLSLIGIVISVIAINFNPIHLFMNNYYTIPFICLLLLFGLYVLFLSNSKMAIKLLIGGGIMIGCLYIGISPLLIQRKLLIIYIIGMLLIFIMCYLYTKLSDRTKYGNEVLGDTYGLKYYLEKMSSDELKARIEENPNFYFDIVPYAYVLDSLDIWIRKGKDIVNNGPSWHIPSSEFNLINFEKFIKNVLYTTTLVMMKQTYSSHGNVTYSNSKVKTNLND